MSHNTFGHLFRVTTWGESHGPAIGCVVDGCPPRIAISEAEIQAYLDKRRPGQSRFTTQRREPDAVKIMSGVFEEGGKLLTTGTPIALEIAERRRALEGLFRDRRELPPRPRRLHLPAEIRHPRLARLRPRLGARDGEPRRRRRDCAQGRPRRHRARRAGAGRPAQDRPRQLGLERGRQQSVLLAGCESRRTLGGLSRRRAQARLVRRRRHRGRRRGRARRPRRADLRQARSGDRRRR